MNKLILTIVILFFNISILFSQTDVVGKKYIYEFRDGTTIIGTFVKEEVGNIYITEMDGKETYLPRVMVAQIHEVTDDNIKDGEYWFKNLHDSRYFFSPTAFSLEEGEGYYNHSYWWLWQVQYGISDNFSIGGGTSILGFPATLNAKMSFEINTDLNYSLGWFWVGDLFGHTGNALGDRSLLNMPYGVITQGSKENNITLGAAYNIASPSSGAAAPISSERLVLNTGGTFRLGRRFSFVFEAWIFNERNEGSTEITLMGGPGIRYFRKINRVTAKNGAGAKTFDFQLMHFPGMGNDGPLFIPMFGASQKF